MTNFEHGPTGPQKEQVENEFRILDEKGEPVEKMYLPDDIGDEFYVEVISDSEQKLLPYKKLIKGIVDHKQGIINWLDGSQTEYNGEEDVVFAEGEERVKSERKIIPEKNIKVGKVDRVNKTISFSEKPLEDIIESSGKLIREEDLQHVIPLLESHYRISKPTEENITPQILRHVADKIQLNISNDEVAEKLRKEILNLSY